MRVFITGATGFVGRMVSARLLGQGHEVVAWCRNPETARDVLGADVVVTSPKDMRLEDALVGCDVIINLQGENVFSGRWTNARKARLEDSRIAFTKSLARAVRVMGSAAPKVLVSSSAVGYYGRDAQTEVSEGASPGQDFLAQLCARWEAAALDLAHEGVRVVVLRIGVVLGSGGGALQKMLPVFRAGLGGVLGSGAQPTSWIHMNDLVSLLCQAATDPRYRGALNACAPQPVTNREFTEALAKTLGRPAALRVPAFALRAALGEAASVVLGGQRTLPAGASALGFRFEFERIDAALKDLLGSGSVRIRDESAGEARHVLEQETEVDAPIREVFAFFSKAENLGAMTPPGLSFSIRDRQGPEMGEGTRLDYDIRLGLVPIRWTSVIEQWVPGVRFADRQKRGPYAHWYHEHHFEARGDRTLMRDVVRYRLPFGILGRLVHHIAVRSQLEEIFTFRGQYTRERFTRPLRLSKTG